MWEDMKFFMRIYFICATSSASSWIFSYNKRYLKFHESVEEKIFVLSWPRVPVLQNPQRLFDIFIEFVLLTCIPLLSERENYFQPFYTVNLDSRLWWNGNYLNIFLEILKEFNVIVRTFSISKKSFNLIGLLSDFRHWSGSNGFLMLSGDLKQDGSHLEKMEIFEDYHESYFLSLSGFQEKEKRK